jgi:hypothetical protein
MEINNQGLRSFVSLKQQVITRPGDQLEQIFFAIGSLIQHI